MVLSGLLSHVGYIRLRGNARTEVTGITCDSREVRPGDLFICLAGCKQDGHTFAKEAIEKGARVVVAEEGNQKAGRLEKQILTVGEEESGTTLVLVASTRKIFSPLASAFYGYPLRSMTSVAVTGTKGKTTTAYMLREILEEAGYKTGLIGTNGAFIGTERLPLSHTTPEAHELQRILKRMKDSGCTHLVMEVSSQGLKMERVAELRFNCGIFTNLSPDHIGPGEHESFAEYLYQKSRLFLSCDVGIINRDDKWAKEITAGAACRLVTYGLSEGEYQGKEPVRYKDSKMLGCEYQLREAESGKNFETETEAESETVFLPLPGEYNIRNSLAAIATANQLGIPVRTAAKALKQVQVPGRMEVISGNNHLWVIVDYAHNENSMESLLKTLKAYEPRRLLCVFGCGGNRSVVRRSGMGRAAGRLADISVVTEDNSRDEPLSGILAAIEEGLRESGGEYVVIPDRREAIGYAIRHGKVGDIIAIIGKGHEEYQETKGHRVPFSDREEAKRALLIYK